MISKNICLNSNEYKGSLNVDRMKDTIIEKHRGITN